MEKFIRGDSTVVDANSFFFCDTKNQSHNPFDFYAVFFFLSSRQFRTTA